MKKIFIFILGIIMIAIGSLAFAEITVNDLKNVFDEYCDSQWATLTDDGYSLEIDTNPKNIDDYYSYSANRAVTEINNALGLPDSANTDINNTTANMGVQTYTMDNLTLSWTYHPDNGLEIWYTIEHAKMAFHSANEIQNIFDTYCEQEWASVSEDGNSLYVDTNPDDDDDGADYDATKAVEKINAAFGLPKSIDIRMNQTTGLMGVQTAEDGNLTVSWTYHPSNGLEVIYSLAGNDDIHHSADELKRVFDEFCDPEWAELSDDGYTLSIDTNPYDRDHYTDSTAYKTVEEINAELGLPDTVYVQMGRTTSLQGLITVTSGNMTVSWTYHPNRGMELTYKIERKSLF